MTVDPDKIVAQAKRAAAREAKHTAAAAAAAQERRECTLVLRGLGWSFGRIATAYGVSKARAAQLGRARS